MMGTDWRRVVGMAIELSEANPDDADWIDALQKAGLSEGEARVTVAMVPVAFGRALLIEQGMKSFAPTFRAYDDKNRPVVLVYGRQPVFREAVTWALGRSVPGPTSSLGAGLSGSFGELVILSRKDGEGSQVA